MLHPSVYKSKADSSTIENNQFGSGKKRFGAFFINNSF